MQKIKSLLNKKTLFTSVLIFSVCLNFLLGLTNFDIGYVPLNKKLIIGNDAPHDTEDTLYLAQGVIAFDNIEKQPKNAMQIMTFYMDKATGKVYLEEAFLIGTAMGFPSREEMELVSFDKASGLITLKGNGWEKIVIDVSNKKAIHLTDTSGDETTLKSTWEIK